MSLSSSRSQWWAQETQASHQASPLDDKLDESELSAGQGHLPAFLSSRSNSTVGTTNDRSGQSPPAQNWNPSSSGSRSLQSPSSRFGSGGLFDRSTTSPYSSPKPQPATSISARETSTLYNEDAPPVASLDDGDMYDATDVQHDSAPISSSPRPETTLSASSSSGSLASTVVVFGPPMSMIQPLLQHFSQFGEITAAQPDPSGGNWVTITYKNEWEAGRAVKRNGDVLGGVWMIGVKWADPNRMDQISLSRSPSAPLQAAPALGQSGSASTNLHRPASGRAIQLQSSSSAFRRLNQLPSSAPTNSNDKTLVEASRGGTAAMPAAPGGVLGKLGELVFGF